MRKWMLFVISLFAALLFMGSDPIYAQEISMEDEDPGYWKANGYYQEELTEHVYTDSKYAIRNEGSPSMNVKFGVDVSKWNGVVDWNKAKANGVQFAIIRVGYRGYGNGSLAEDPYYRQNIEGALAAGIPVGVYIFSQAITEAEAIEEANYLLARISSYKITLPVVMDFEYTGSNGTDGRLYQANLSVDQATNICKAFLKTVKNAGYTPMLYANKYMLSSKLNAAAIEKDYRIWLAHYTSATNYQGIYDFWQYTSTGDGYQYGMGSQYVDLNYWYDDGSIGSTVYNITYNLDGGKNNSANPKTYSSAYGATLKNPSRKGYTFSGWYTDSKYKNKVTEIPKGSTGNKKLYAKWAVNKFTIQFSGNGATSGKMSALKDRVYGKSYTLPANTYKRTGYKFTGWNTKKDGSGKSYADKGKIKSTTSKNGATITFYAQWQKVKYTVAYELNGGTNNKNNPTSYYVTTSTKKLKNPTRKGYTFKGWYSDSKYKNKVTEIAKGSKGNKKLYAKWAVNKFTIQFSGNGATSGKMSALKDRVYGKSYTLPANTYKRTGYKFTGWNTKKDGSGKSYADKGKIKSTTSKNGATITFYAQWQKVKYTVAYELNGGTNNKNNPTSYYVTTSTKKLQNPTRKGYTFKGWYSDSKYKNKVTEIAKGSTGNKKLYAKWEANKFTIQFSGNGATSGKMSALKDRTYGKSYALPANTYKRTGYKFTGWNTQKDGSGKSYADKGKIKSTTSKNGATITFYAQWEKVKYTVTYELNGGTNNKNNPTSYYVTTSTKKLQNPTRKGYTFKGWYSDSKYKNKVTEIAKGSTGNKKLYAQWNENMYSITFDGNGATSGEMMSMENCAYSGTYALLQNTFEKEGYVFAGWNTEVDGSGNSYADLEEISALTTLPDENVVLYAQWELQ